MRYQFAGCTLDTETLEIAVGDAVVDVEPQVFEVLRYLVENHERVVSKDELLDAVWGDRFVSESALTTRIKQARRLINDDGRAQRMIKTVHGRGYRLVTGVNVVDKADVDTPARPPATAVTKLPRTRYAESDGYSIAYQVFGEGPPLVFIGGFVSNVDMQWEHPDIAGFLRRLGKFARVIVLDKRGVGLSDRIPSSAIPSLEKRADDVRAVMDAAGIERATIFGSSEGGPLSMLLAAAAPERVDRLALHATFAHHPWAARPQPIPEIKQTEEAWGTGAVCAYLGPGLARTEADRRFLARWERHGASPLAAKHLVELMIGIDVTDVLPVIDVPTAVLHRINDEVITIDSGRDVARRIPGAHMIELPGSDHWVFSGDTGQIASALEEFVTGTSPAEEPSSRQLATVLFVDIVGSTQAARRMGDAEWVKLLTEFESVATAALGTERGDLISTTGDGFVATFDGPGRGVRAACAVREAAKPLGITVRSGLHTAEVERRGSDIAGIGVHIASRVADAADEGEVWVSRTVTDLVAGCGLRFDGKGEHELRGLDEPWALYEVVG